MSKGMKAVVLGGRTGMLGQSLVRILEENGWTATPQGREDVDIFDSEGLARFIDRAEPDFVFNAVAYTAVDKAEDEPAEAMRLNKAFPLSLAKMAKKSGFHLVHYSTDFVFDGKERAPYQVEHQTNPLCVYGLTKLAGEKAMLEVGPDKMMILRTAWLFGPGRKNFVKTILNLAKDRDQLNVVHDQIGSPTYTVDLARYSLDLALKQARGIFHVVNGGVASWCELAAEAVNLAGLTCTINAIPSAEYPQKALRPAYSVLSTDKFTQATGVSPRPWVQGLRDYIFQELPAQLGLKPGQTYC